MKNVSKNEIQQIIWLHEKMRDSFFWKPNTNAARRRSFEEANSLSVEGLFMRCPISLKCETSCSCKNIYYKGDFYINNKKVTIASVKKLIN